MKGEMYVATSRHKVAGLTNAKLDLRAPAIFLSILVYACLSLCLHGCAPCGIASDCTCLSSAAFVAEGVIELRLESASLSFAW